MYLFSKFCVKMLKKIGAVINFVVILHLICEKTINI